jgi:hypothetical protein
MFSARLSVFAPLRLLFPLVPASPLRRCERDKRKAHPRRIDCVLFFELFPAVFAVIALIVGVALFAVNRRAQNNRETELPRAPSRPELDPGSEPPPAKASSRPSMRA